MKLEDSNLMVEKKRRGNLKKGGEFKVLFDGGRSLSNENPGHQYRN